jgi:hypothetical protein
MVAKDATANSEHHRPVTPNQRLERTLVLRFDEAIEKLSVSGLDGITRLQGCANAVEDLAKRVVRHFASPFLTGLGLWS